MKVNQFPDRIIEIDNETYLYFGGTAYLGLPTNKKFQKLLIKNILQWGTAYGSSRNANIQLTAYENGERFLANYIEADATLTVSSGMLAGKLVIEVLTPQTDCFFHFPDTHPAIKAPNSLPFFIGNQLNPRLLDNVTEKITILTDAVPSFHIEPIDLSILNSIPSNKEITLVIDESHSLGILGTKGCGIYSTIDLPSIKRKIMIASLGKAFGLTGGVIASDIDFINQMANHDTFVSSAGMNAAFVQTIADAEKIYFTQHQKLKDNLNYIDTHLIKSKAVLFNPNYPLIYPEIEGINEIFTTNKIIVTNFKYPTDSKDLNRIVATANHKKEDLDKIIHILNQNQF
ncbi:aminotransferase class I/II-fold pyridoxal phosphate-dependent enzyme [Flavobacterium gawalongense]|uniref:Pyridoxal phosphate-dependent aminotransferase family protein n=1 Tax=Flavobacterium gawalongense TaxID=2594432 RepID=A0A553BC17_9FLAO|nr:aminotransferase class I/II-fold pyridoxal phosphate-dependent enzyme [Flavobacterium gawalongense]TRW98078.1 pyridoxal phosphate-dependent aminotransferase family protein [Flavobacterium gawalongense]TRX02703.1 pyridoxal phosphate-dependent aminotransferase family protein [Flavobacterium gawalongense]TRX05778.1 pyridoxal phosphate-dependent aminotransferase family protein [Flavobacterium gawalongense]TRX06685.1 pyridoxal phosphate-dependent aminotransferase family protein [Flavobacterium ga